MQLCKGKHCSLYSVVLQGTTSDSRALRCLGMRDDDGLDDERACREKDRDQQIPVAGLTGTTRSNQTGGFIARFSRR